MTTHLGPDALAPTSSFAAVAPPLTAALAGYRTPVLLLGAVLAGLQAGTYYTWATGVMPGLRHVDDRTFVEALQQINVSIVNPVFLLSFFGAPLLALVAVAATTGSARRLAVAGAVLAAATLLITIGGNIPLNDALAAAGPVGSIQDLHAVRAHFENLWTALNIARTLTATGALTCLAWAALRS